MSFPSFSVRSSRLSGLAMTLVLIAVLSASAGQSAAGATTTVGQSPGRLPGEWQWPVGQPRQIVRAFEAPATPYAAGHRGIDVAADAGSTVRAPADGIVYFVGIVVDRPVLSIRHGDGVISSFEPVESTLAEGSTVAMGDAIGTVALGHCRSACVHIGARLNGQYVSPLKYLGGIPASVLLPTRRIR